MPVSRQMIGIPGDECQCGRRATIRHCPECGSFRTYGRSGRMHKHLDGVERLVERQFRCQACTHLFIDEEREFCEAPPVGQKLAAQRVKALHEASSGSLTPAEQIAANSLGRLISGDKATNKGLNDEELAKLKTELRKSYAQHLLEYNSKQRTDHPGDVEAYIANGVKMLEAEWLKASQA